MRAAAGSTGTAPKVPVFWGALLLIVVADVLTKYLAHTRLQPRHVPREVFGDLVRLTLGYNPGAAFGMYLGEHSRWIFLGLALLILVFLGIMYREARPTDRIRALALGLVSGGVIGNVINRIWSAGGVVDFLDIGIGAARWPTFNVADIGVTVGAFLLAWVLWSEQGGASSEASGTNARQAQTNP